MSNKFSFICQVLQDQLPKISKKPSSLVVDPDRHVTARHLRVKTGQFLKNLMYRTAIDPPPPHAERLHRFVFDADRHVECLDDT
jgi:hypothetical protein